MPINGAPLFDVVPVPWEAPDPGAFDGLLIGSANVFRKGGDALHRLRELPVLAVGATTADCARDAGFVVARVGTGGLQTVLSQVEGPARLLRLCGEDRVALTPPEDVRIEERVVYRVEARPFPKALMQDLRSGAIVLLHSAAAARHFAAECDRRGIARQGIAIAALGPRIAEAAGSGWRKLAWPETPDDPALLALVGDMWQELGP
ncbi:uroporphyrinogen-III synthase [Qipengyuania sp. JC766]|uniref:uroporphyrinogen-III synthase n=1 Tax=Qipengyuania sp. JC766 TaxID=3232139 RepID=UPI003458D4D9